jgi:hypothetical protein
MSHDRAVSGAAPPAAAAAFPTFLANFDADALARDASTIVALDPAGIMLWMNDAWTRFARENGGDAVLARFGVGACYFDGIGPILRGYYEGAFANALLTSEPFVQEYECSSGEIFRLFFLRVLPIDARGFLVEHSLRVAQPHDRPPCEAIEARYRNARGFLVQCSNCRRMRRADGRTWEWVPAWAEHATPDTSHGLCHACAGFYWGEHPR